MMGEKKESKLNKSLRLLIASSVIVFIGVAFSKIFTYIYRIIIGRHFGPEEYGLFSLATMMVILIVALFSIGLPEGLVRYVSFFRGRKDKGKIKYIIKKSFKILLFSSLIGFLLLFFTSGLISNVIFHNQKLKLFITLSAIAIPFFILANFYLSILRSYEKIGGYSFIHNFLQNFSKLIILLALILIGIGSESIMISYVGGIIIMFLASYYISRKFVNNIFGKKVVSENNNRIMGDLISYSWPISLLGLASFVLYWIDSFTIGYFKDVFEVGLYNAAVPIAALVMIAPDLFIQLFFPLISKVYANRGKKLISEISKQITKWIFIVNLPITFILILFPGAIINLLFGETYLAAENALRILALGSLFGSLTIIPSNLVSMTGRSKVVLLNILSMLILNLILNIILVPKYGMNGAALSTTFIFISLFFIYLFQIRKYLSFIPLRRKMFGILCASIIPLLIVISIKNLFSITSLVLILLGIVFVILYLIFILLFRCLDKNDLLIIRQFRNKISRKN